MMDYSHPKHYFIIGIIGILITFLIGFTVQKGVYAGMLGMMVFPPIYYIATKKETTQDRKILEEFLMSLIGFIFIPLAYVLGFSFNWIPTTIDLLFFGIGFCTIGLATSTLYIIEPETKGEYLIAIATGSLILIGTIIIIKLTTYGYYLWGIS